MAAYYDRTKEDKPEKVPQIFSKCSEAMLKWISSHSILGNPESTTFDMAIVLPVVNPATGKLNKGAVSSANAYASQVGDISDDTLKKTKKYLTKMYKKYFKVDASKEELMDLGLDTLKQLEDDPGPIDLIQSIINTPMEPIVLPDSIPEVELTEEDLAVVERMLISCEAFDERCEELETEPLEE